MIKSFLILIIFPIFLFSSQQIILVVADDFNSSNAKLEFFDDKERLFSFDVNLGKNGLGWGIGESNLKKKNMNHLNMKAIKKHQLVFLN